MQSGQLSCSCPDFYMRHRLCKHLYFIIGRIAQSIPLTRTLSQRGADMLEASEFLALATALRQQLASRQSGTSNPSATQLGQVGDTCCICYEDLGGEAVIRCETTCHNTFHQACMAVWLHRNASCPLCRSPWSPDKPGPGDELSNLVSVRLKPVIQLKYKSSS